MRKKEEKRSLFGEVEDGRKKNKKRNGSRCNIVFNGCTVNYGAYFMCSIVNHSYCIVGCLVCSICSVTASRYSAADPTITQPNNNCRSFIRQINKLNYNFACFAGYTATQTACGWRGGQGQ